MAESFDGKVALVTGAGRGIGFAAAKAFAEAGASVILVDQNEELISIATDELCSDGHNVCGLTCDVSDSAQVKARFGQVLRKYGRLDAAFNNAGVNCDAVPLLDTSDEEYERIVGVNLRGVWNCMKAELSEMVRRGSGTIVNCSSIGGLVGSPGRSAYSASKHAVIGLTKSAAHEYAAQGIRINAICPGVFKTPMCEAVSHQYSPEIVGRMLARAPIGRFGEPEEIAGAVLWLCGSTSTYMIGHALVIDGGFLSR
jgi:NAD(P)-dependent dehydrogenase (short-subunit alcohol dehydrogenase family)